MNPWSTMQQRRRGNPLFPTNLNQNKLTNLNVRPRKEDAGMRTPPTPDSEAQVSSSERSGPT